MRASRRITVALAVATAGLSVAAGCGGESSGPSYSDKQIVEKLNLEEVQNDGLYAILGDPFCEVQRKLLNDADEVSQAGDGSGGGLLITSRAGNVGVVATPAMAPDCREKAKKKLDKLDP